MERGKGWRATAALEGLDAALGMGLIKGQRGQRSGAGPQGQKIPFFP